ENGYEGTRVSDIVALSGVSRSAFYKHFDDKLDCFLATVDEIYSLVEQQMERAYDPELPWEKRLRTVADAFVELVLAQPAAAKVCLVEIYAAGPDAIARLDGAVAVVERIVARALDDSPERAGMPRAIVAAIIGGAHKTIHTRLRRGEERKLVPLMDDLVDWVLSYRTPPEKLRKPRRRPDRGAAPEPDHSKPRERLISAITEVMANRGYPDTTIIEIAETASASLSTFYANFENKEEAFIAALGRERVESLAAAQAAFEAAPDWGAAVRDGLDALFAYLAAEPAAARLAIVESYRGGPEVLEDADKTVRAFHRFLEPGYAIADGLDPLTSEAIGNAINALAYTQIRSERVERLRELGPTAAFICLAPFLGAADACATANEAA
ncbi:MAG: TetR/AcrR family transcriptional regulator, partial [Solirubrobacterales bacterium]|nr:TetR/AcrR family transcriptional regulator [Solirubrobacterales bacterium]